MNPKQLIQQDILQRTMQNLEKNRMQVFYTETKEGVLPIVQSLIKPGDSVAAGGSESLFETGIIDELRSGKYQFYDLFQPNLSKEEFRRMKLAAFAVDTYFCSTNAVTQKGELFNIDQESNRAAALLYGPEQVILVVGVQKIVPDLEAALARVKYLAAPANAVRLSYDTYCLEHHHCQSSVADLEHMTAGCRHQGRICCNYVVSAFQKFENRIKIIFVGEEVGY